ncbi:MAG: hypothetical protein AAF039_13705 [Bacteroidota bacterium]
MKTNVFYLLLFSVLLLGCSKDDSPFVDVENTVDLETMFYGKTWSIYEVEGNGERVPIPEEGGCGRDYFRYLETGEYIEYLHQNSSCVPDINRLDFLIKGSTISLSNGIGEEAEIRILKLDETQFNFETSLDIDGDQKEDKVKLYCRQYSPRDRDIYSDTFNKDFDKFQDDNLIAFSWTEYVGDGFQQYEIFRASNGCSKNAAVKIATITDLSQTAFVDLDPEPVQELCYFFRLLTDEGTLAESELISVNTSSLSVLKVPMLPAQLTSTTVQLNWEAYEGTYFDRYEITVSQRPYNNGSPEEIIVATIQNQETTSLTIETPPSVDNPYYNIHVYNIFGYRSSLDVGGSFTNNTIEVVFSPSEVVDMLIVRLLASDPNEGNFLYLWGESVEDTFKKIKKYDVVAKEVVAESSFDLNTSSEERMRIFDSTEGKEVFMQVGWEMHVFDAQTLEYKYRLRDIADEPISFEDLLYLKDDIWVIADDGDKLRTVRRFGRDVQTIDVLDPEPSTNFKRMEELIQTGENQILAGIKNDTRSFLFDIGPNGEITNAQEVNYTFSSPATLRLPKSNEYNEVSNILIDMVNSRIYSADDFSFISSYSFPTFTSSLSLDGEFVLGTNNNGNNSIDLNERDSRELKLLNWRSGQVTTIETIGYPQYVYENLDGKLVVVSSYFKRSFFWRGDSKNDLFVEVFDW